MADACCLDVENGEKVTILYFLVLDRDHKQLGLFDQPYLSTAPIVMSCVASTVHVNCIGKGHQPKD